MSLRDPQIWEVMEDTGFVALARLLDMDGNLLTQANTTSIEAWCFDVDDNDTETLNTTPAKADVIFDAEQFGGDWPHTDVGDGYTFRYALPATAIPTGGHRHVVEVMITPLAGEVFMLDPYHIDVINRRGG